MLNPVRFSGNFASCHWRKLLRRQGAAVGLICLGSSLALLPPGGRAATAEDYLHQIEADAKQLAATPITTQTTAVPGMLDATERLPLGLPQEGFEKTLHDQFVGTYVFYQRLTAESKAKVYESYKQDNRVSTIREQTLKLLSSGTP
jgi:hypothetical protein